MGIVEKRGCGLYNYGSAVPLSIMETEDPGNGFIVKELYTRNYYIIMSLINNYCVR